MRTILDVLVQVLYIYFKSDKYQASLTLNLDVRIKEWKINLNTLNYDKSQVSLTLILSVRIKQSFLGILHKIKFDSSDFSAPIFNSLPIN